MKKENFSLAIQNPCSESWSAMRAAKDGRYCSSCCKTVVDFTGMNADTISEFFSENAGKKVCGNFYREQLFENYTITHKNPYSFNSALLKISLAGILIFSGVKAGAQTVNNNVEIIKDNSGNTLTAKTGDGAVKNKTNKLNIKVTNAEGKLLNGSRIMITEANDTYTSTDGNFSIVIADSLKEKKLQLTIFAPGYASVSRTVEMSKEGRELLVVKMEEREMIRGEIEYIPENKKKCGNK